MRVIIAGSRHIISMQELEKAISDSNFEITEVISGGAPGVDKLADIWAQRNEITFHRIPAKWKSFGKGAGVKRNAQMANYAYEKQGALIAVWDGMSRGTKNMIEQAEKYLLECHVHYVNRKDCTYFKDKEYEK